MSRVSLKTIGLTLELSLVIVFASCKNQNNIEYIGLIEYPDSALVIVDDRIMETDSSIIRLPALCFWLDSTKCTPCEYDMLYNFEPYFGVHGNTGFFVIVSPAAVHKHDIDYKVTIDGFNFPVIVDKSCSFYRKNKTLYVNENENLYIYIDENGWGYELILSEEDMTYDIGKVTDYITLNIR